VSYTLRCVRRENFFQSCRSIWRLRWGRQVTADLYIGLGLFLLFVYRFDSPQAALAWAPATLALGNLATLAYLLTHLDQFLG